MNSLHADCCNGSLLYHLLVAVVQLIAMFMVWLRRRPLTEKFGKVRTELREAQAEMEKERRQNASLRQSLAAAKGEIARMRTLLASAEAATAGERDRVEKKGARVAAALQQALDQYEQECWRIDLMPVSDGNRESLRFDAGARLAECLARLLGRTVNVPV